MVNYKCSKCGRVFDRKIGLERHLARKTQCTKFSGSKTNKKVFDPKCKGCGKSYSRKDSLNRHMKICKGNINKNITKGNKNSKIINNNVTGNENNINNIETQNNKININNPVINPTINLIFFGKDGIDSLTSDDFIKILKSHDNPYESIIKIINFDPNKPNHHNVYYPDMKATYGKVYENKKWVDKKINEIINSILDSKTDDLHEILKKFDGILSKKIRQNIIKTIKDVDYSNPNCRKKLISYIKPILYYN